MVHVLLTPCIFLFAKSRQQNGYACEASHNAAVAERDLVCVLQTVLRCKLFHGRTETFLREGRGGIVITPLSVNAEQRT